MCMTPHTVLKLNCDESYVNRGQTGGSNEWFKKHS